MKKITVLVCVTLVLAALMNLDQLSDCNRASERSVPPTGDVLYQMQISPPGGQICVKVKDVLQVDIVDLNDKHVHTEAFPDPTQLTYCWNGPVDYLAWQSGSTFEPNVLKIDSGHRVIWTRDLPVDP